MCPAANTPCNALQALSRRNADRAETDVRNSHHSVCYRPFQSTWIQREETDLQSPDPA